MTRNYGANENLSDEVQESLRFAFGEVYDRHDQRAPLNHVNLVEWIEAVSGVIAEVWDDGWDTARGVNALACPSDYNPHR